MTLLTRMQWNKTNNYVYYFLLYVLAINADSITPDYLIQTVNETQSGYYSGHVLCPPGADSCTRAVDLNSV